MAIQPTRDAEAALARLNSAAQVAHVSHLLYSDLFLLCFLVTSCWLHHPRPVPQPHRRRLRRDPRPAGAAHRPVLRRGARPRAGRLAPDRRRRPRPPASPPPPSRHRCRTTTACAPTACPPRSCRASATSSAPTPTSASTSPAPSTPCGRATAPRSRPKTRTDPRLLSRRSAAQAGRTLWLRQKRFCGSHSRLTAARRAIVVGRVHPRDQSRIRRRREVAVERLPRAPRSRPTRPGSAAGSRRRRAPGCRRRRPSRTTSRRGRGRPWRPAARRRTRRRASAGRAPTPGSPRGTTTSRSIASSVSSRSSVLPPTKPGIGCSGSAGGHLQQDVGIRPHPERRSRSRRRSASSGASAARAADSSSPIQHAAIVAPAGALGSIARHVHEGDGELARGVAQRVAQSPQDRAASRRSTPSVANTTAGSSWARKSKRVTTPKLPPPPRSAHSSSGCDASVTSRTSPPRRDELRADELIGRETPRAHHPADAAAEGQTADADRRRVARADAEAVLGERARDARPTSPRRRRARACRRPRRRRARRGRA